MPRTTLPNCQFAPSVPPPIKPDTSVFAACRPTKAGNSGSLNVSFERPQTPPTVAPTYTPDQLGAKTDGCALTGRRAGRSAALAIVAPATPPARASKAKNLNFITTLPSTR